MLVCRSQRHGLAEEGRKCQLAHSQRSRDTLSWAPLLRGTRFSLLALLFCFSFWTVLEMFPDPKTCQHVGLILCGTEFLSKACQQCKASACFMGLECRATTYWVVLERLMPSGKSKPLALLSGDCPCRSELCHGRRPLVSVQEGTFPVWTDALSEWWETSDGVESSFYRGGDWY